MVKKLVFLDRDGVINTYPGDGKYVLSKEQLKVFPFVKDSLKKLKEAGFLIYVISNQACVSKGLITPQELIELTSYMLSLIEDSQPFPPSPKSLEPGSGLISGVYYCIHREEENCPFRKPSPGLIKEVLKSLNIPEPETDKHILFFIGDSLRDVKTAKSLNIKSILVLSGKERLENRFCWDTQPDYIFPDLKEAVDFILKNSGT